MRSKGMPQAKSQEQSAEVERHRISVRQVAQKFRRTRQEAGLSVRQLAEKAGLSPSTVLKLEKGELIPSIAVCIRLADALERKISYFVEESDAMVDVRLIRRGTGRVIAKRGGLVRTEVLAEPLHDPRMEAFLLTISPGATSGDEVPIRYRGEEIVFGIKGRVQFHIGGDSYTVGPGDTLHFKADIPHRWENPGPRVAEIHMICAFGYGR